MKKRIQKKLELSRETLRSLAETGLGEVDGGRSETCTWIWLRTAGGGESPQTPSTS